MYMISRPLHDERSGELVFTKRSTEQNCMKSQSLDWMKILTIAVALTMMCT